uniref:Putative secreted protein n=1 Tax=Anopheles triannulatus TaxID=58253 RepID=A0A2M4B782_9DIPT
MRCSGAEWKVFPIFLLLPFASSSPNPYIPWLGGGGELAIANEGIERSCSNTNTTTCVASIKPCGAEKEHKGKKGL